MILNDISAMSFGFGGPLSLLRRVIISSATVKKTKNIDFRAAKV